MNKSTDRSSSVDSAVAPFGRRPLRTFAFAIALPALLLYVVSVALVILALEGMAREINRLEEVRGLTSMHAALDSFLNDLSSAVADEGTWDEAFLNVVVSPNPAWMDTTWGATARLGQTYDTVLVTDQAGKIVFGEDAAGPITGDIATRFPSAVAMLKQLDSGISATTDATMISRFAADGSGMMGIAAISIHRTAGGQLPVPRQDRRVLWIGRHLTPSLLQDIAVRYQTPLAAPTTQPDPRASTITLSGADGKSVGTLAWIADRPGDSAFNHAVLLASAVFVVIGAALAVGLSQLRRAILRRADAFDAAHQRAPDAAVTALPTELPTAAQSASDRVAGSPSSIAAVNVGDFAIEYQPILDFKAEALTGVEALLRWSSASGTPVRQEDLSPLDCARLLDRIGIIALRRAADEIAPLLGLTLVAPVTPAQLASAVFAEKVAGTLGATNLHARRLQLKIDATLLPEPELVTVAVGELRRRGVTVAIGNYALDASTARYLDARLVDRVCIGPAMAAPPAGPAREAHLRSSVEMARAGGAEIVADRLERPEEVVRLVRLGCREVQGKLFAAAMPIAALMRLVLAPRPAEIRKTG
ncbi:MAG TPA: EAL domain-containing protein [Devosia sp.]|nr:EAL domain-containing protein [Devosia sp.]